MRTRKAVEPMVITTEIANPEVPGKARIFLTFFLVPSEDFILSAQHIIMFGPFLSQFQYNHAWHVTRNEQIK
jgi:hypothetical protein